MPHGTACVAQPPPAGDDRPDRSDQSNAVQEATRLLGEYGRADLAAREAANDLQRELDAVKRAYQARIESTANARGIAEGTLQHFCDDHRADLLSGDAKSVALLYGVIGWRTPPQAVRQARGVTADESARRLLSLGHPVCVRETISLHKPAIQEEWAAGALSPADLKHVGLRISQGPDAFYSQLDVRAILKLITG